MTNQLLRSYRFLLSQIEKQNDDEFTDLVDQIDQQLPNDEGELHRQLLTEIVKVNEKVKQIYWISENLKILHELGHTFTKTFDEEQIYRKAFELVSRVMRADAFMIAFYNEGDEEISVPFSIDSGVDYGSTTVPFGQGMISKVLTTKEMIHLKTHRESNPSDIVRWGNPDLDTNTCIFVPMLLGDQIKGVISAQSYQEFAYKQEHEELLKIIGFQVASAIETAKLYDKLYQMSIIDELTHIKNYRAFHQDLEKLLASGERSVTLTMLDSDNLKVVNDQYGHQMGDLMIQKIAEAMRVSSTVRESVYRYAGDEFMILAPQTSLDEAKRQVLRIKEYLLDNPIYHLGVVIPVTVSVGIAQYPEHANSADTLKRAADEALYRSKKGGKDLVTIYQVV